MLSGIGAGASLVCGMLFARASDTYGDALTPDPSASLSLVALILGTTAVILGLVAVVSRFASRWKGIVGICLGFVPLAFSASAWIASRPPNISVDDLCSVRDRAVPIMEKMTGLSFKSPVIVELGSNEFETSKLQDDMRGRLEHPQFSLPFAFVGLYDQKRKILYVMPDGIGKMQRKGVLKRGRAQEIARAVLINELVHALDDQNGMVESKAELLRMPKIDQNRFWIRRAIMEGRSSFYGRKVCHELGIRPFDEYLTGAGGDDKKPGIFAEMMLGMLRFIYGDGPRFFEWLDGAGRADLISRASLHAPPMLHHIERPDIYARDVDSGMEERFAKTFAHLAEVFPSSAWKAGWARSHGLVELPRSIFVDPDFSGKKAEFQRLPIAAWLGSFTKTAGEGRASLRLWRFPDEDVAAKGVDMRLSIWRENAARDAKRLQEESRECPEASSYVFIRRIDLKDVANPTAEFRCLARSGSFILEARFRESTGEVQAKAIADKLVRSFLVPLGTSD